MNNAGRHSRDFTYVDDIVEGVIRASDRPAAPDPDWDPRDPDPATSNAPFRIYNIGNNDPVQLGDFIAALEAALGRRATFEMRPLQPGDALDTYADSARLARAVNWRPSTPVAVGVRALRRLVPRALRRPDRPARPLTPAGARMTSCVRPAHRAPNGPIPARGSAGSP